MKDPRIVRFGALEYRFVDGHLEWRVPGRAWIADPHKPEEFAAVGDLVNHPSQRKDSAA